MRRKDVAVGDGIQVIGRFGDLVTIPDEHRTAIEAALAAPAGNMVVLMRPSCGAFSTAVTRSKAARLP
ncbi:MAG: hypothetical protein H6669_14810 [Ardenticatenaceae bacterium]|nr:hypothetical protein [Ardenticatenaceae bacterium]